MSTKRVNLSQTQYNFMQDLDTVGRSFNYYIQRLQTQYLKNISIDEGYPADANLEFKLDLKDNAKRTLIIKELPYPAPKEPPMHS